MIKLLRVTGLMFILTFVPTVDCGLPTADFFFVKVRRKIKNSCIIICIAFFNYFAKLYFYMNYYICAYLELFYIRKDSHG